MRIKHRKHGRTAQSSRKGGFTHVVKIGFDRREIEPLDREGKPAAYPKPGKLPGFLICRDSIDPRTMNLLVDEQAMLRLGKQFDAKAILEAKRKQLDGIGHLPTTLRFVLRRNAVLKGAEWTYPEGVAEEYEKWGKDGLFCHGNGEFAERCGDTGVRRIVACNPAGKAGIEDAKEFCQYSVAKECKPHTRITLSLFIEGPPDETGKPTLLPLSSELGWDAKYRLDTSSGYSPIAFLDELDSAAEYLAQDIDGQRVGLLSGITGTITFTVQRKRTRDAKSPIGITQQLQITLSREDIARRRREIDEWRMSQRQALTTEAAPQRLALPGEAAPAAPAAESPAAPQAAPARPPYTPPPPPGGYSGFAGDDEEDGQFERDEQPEEQHQERQAPTRPAAQPAAANAAPADDSLARHAAYIRETLLAEADGNQSAAEQALRDLSRFSDANGQTNEIRDFDHLETLLGRGSKWIHSVYGKLSKMASPQKEDMFEDAEDAPKDQLAEYSDDDLIAALDAYASALAKEYGEPYETALVRFSFVDIDGKRTSIRSLDWYTKGKAGEPDRKRRAVLRDVVRRIIADNDPRFALKRAQKAVA